jgi:hypothetical protein
MEYQTAGMPLNSRPSGLSPPSEFRHFRKPDGAGCRNDSQRNAYHGADGGMDPFICQRAQLTGGERQQNMLNQENGYQIDRSISGIRFNTAPIDWRTGPLFSILLCMLLPNPKTKKKKEAPKRRSSADYFFPVSFRTAQARPGERPRRDDPPEFIKVAVGN